jgi:hypothetical protein
MKGKKKKTFNFLGQVASNSCGPGLLINSNMRAWILNEGNLYNDGIQ